MPPSSNFNKSCLALAIAQTLTHGVAQAATVTVDSLDAPFADSTECDLTDALVTVNRGSNSDTGCSVDTSNGSLGVNDTIVFDPSVANSLHFIDTSIIKSVSINPNGPRIDIVSYIIGAPVFFISNAEVSLNNLKISSGFSENFNGGGISIINSTVNIDNSEITSNMAPSGGGISAVDSIVNINDSVITRNTSSFGDGGGIDATNSKVSLNNSVVSDNYASFRGGGIQLFGEGGYLNLSNSTVSNNTAERGSGGGVGVVFSNFSAQSSTFADNSSGLGGAGIDISESQVNLNDIKVSSNSGNGLRVSGVSSSVEVSNSEISDNSGLSAGGVSVASRGQMSVSNTTVSGNSSSTDGGGFRVVSGAHLTLNSVTISGNSADKRGGGIEAITGGIVDLINSTVSGNSASSGGGIQVGAYSSYVPVGRVNLSNTTLSDNSADRGGGILLNYDGEASFSNSIVANSTGGDCVNDSSVPVTASPANIIADGGCNTGALSIDPLLRPLANNGGPTQTHALVASSPAINAGIGLGATESDQRGVPALGIRDLGAFEYRLTIAPIVDLLLQDEDEIE